jgi:hypothetical protein
MNTDSLLPITRIIVREVAYGLNDEDICVQHPEFQPHQIAKMRAGATFKRALSELNAAIDDELVLKAAEDPVRAFLAGKGLSAAKTLARLSENEDEDVPHAVQAKAADSILNRSGYGGLQDTVALPVLMLSKEKLDSVLNPKTVLLDNVPDSVDGHKGDLQKLA